MFAKTLLIFSGLLTFVSGCVTFSMSSKHIMNMLISLEFMSLSLFLILYTLSLSSGFNLFLLMVLLVMMVCEGALGLSILSSMARAYGSDSLQAVMPILWQ